MPSNAARNHNPDGYRWFTDACTLLEVGVGDVALQWNTLAKITALTGIAPDQIGVAEFEHTRRTVIDAYLARGLPNSGRNIASIFHRLQLTLFHAGHLDSATRPASRPPVSVTGWTGVAPGIAEVARRYVAQITLSLRPATVKHIEHDLREFAAGRQPPDGGHLRRHHIEDYKSWVAAKHGRYTGKPLNRISIKNRLINLHCLFNRITEWGYPDPPQRPLIFAGIYPSSTNPCPVSSTTPPPPSSCGPPAPTPTLCPA